MSSFRASPHPRCPLRSLLYPNLATAPCTAVRLGLPGKCDALAPMSRWWAPEGPPLPLLRYLWPPPMAGLALPSPDQLMVAMPGDRSRLGRGTGCKGRRRGEGAGVGGCRRPGRGCGGRGVPCPSLAAPLCRGSGARWGRKVGERSKRRAGGSPPQPAAPRAWSGRVGCSRREAGGLAAGGRVA